MLKDAKDDIIAEFAERMQRRKLFKALDVSAALNSKIKQDNPDINREELHSKVEVAEAKIREVIQGEIAEAEAKGQKPALLADLANRNPYKRHRGDDATLKTIYAKDQDGTLRDLADVSDVVRALKPFKAYRVYHADSDSKTETKVNTIIAEQLK